METHHLKNLARLKVKVHLYPTRVTEPFEVAFVLGKNTAIKLFRPFLINLVQVIWNVTKCRKVACPEAKRRLTGTAGGRFESWPGCPQSNECLFLRRRRVTEILVACPKDPPGGRPAGRLARPAGACQTPFVGLARKIDISYFNFSSVPSLTHSEFLSLCCMNT